MIFNTSVNGIPCQCHVLDAETELNSFDFELLDRKGYRAKWLDRYIDYGVRSRLFNEFEDHRIQLLYERYQNQDDYEDAY